MGGFGFFQSLRKLLKNYGKVLFYETCFKESNINWKPLIRSKYKIITKFEPKIGRFWFLAKCAKTAQKLRKIFIWRNFEESNINRKQLILSKYKKITKFEPKKWASFVLGKVYENWPTVEEKCYFTKHFSKRVISTRNN